MSEGKISQELSDEELKDVAGGAQGQIKAGYNGGPFKPGDVGMHDTMAATLKGKRNKPENSTVKAGGEARE